MDSEDSRSPVINIGSNRTPGESINVLKTIEKDQGEFVKDRNGRYRIVYPDDDTIDEYHSCIRRMSFVGDLNSEEFLDSVKLLLEGVEEQKRKRYNYSVTRNPENKALLHPSKTNCYREGKEFNVVKPNVNSHLYKHLRENSAVRMVKDMVTGFTHICKTIIMSKFRCEEVNAMLFLKARAPELYNVSRHGEYINLHEEFINGTRLDIAANHLLNEHLWPLGLYIFSEILDAIRDLMKCGLSHSDIHTKNIIIEVVKEGKLRMRLIDYGDACQYTMSSLVSDLRSLVACLIAVFTRNDFDPFEQDPEEWIESNPGLWENYPKLWNILKGGLDVKNSKNLTELIKCVEILIGTDKKIEKSLGEIAKILDSESRLPANILNLSLQNDIVERR